ncbi:nucleotide exchange factor GrpE [Oscillibacter valericigenes]|nr:nucleotide exchange factor GrpE [Oscillibacter valericigenes]
MSKQDKQNAQPEIPEQEAQAAAAAAEKELPPEDRKAEEAAEIFTLTREQMEKMEGLAKSLAEEHDQYLRLAAEYDNYRKRTAKEKESIYADAKIDTIKGMLPVYDNLERGLAQFGAGDDDPHKKGLEMIFTQFKESLTKLGVTPIDCLGKEFDPERHNAVMHVEDESCGENTVVEVLQQGFMLGEKVLRFAIVKVAN